MVYNVEQKGGMCMRLTLGEKINLLCKSKNMKKTAIAEELGISQGHLSRILNDKQSPSAELLQGIADYFDVEMEYFDTDLEERIMNEIPEVWDNMSTDLQEWILKKDSRPMLILAKVADTTKIPASQIADLITALRKQRDQED